MTRITVERFISFLVPWPFYDLLRDDRQETRVLGIQCARSDGLLRRGLIRLVCNDSSQPIAPALEVVLAAEGVGYVAGLEKAGYDMQVIMVDENAGLLTQRIDFLAKLRAGETAEVTRRLQSSLNNLVLMSAYRPARSIGDFDPDTLPLNQLRALQVA